MLSQTQCRALRAAIVAFDDEELDESISAVLRPLLPRLAPSGRLPVELLLEEHELWALRALPPADAEGSSVLKPMRQRLVEVL